MRTIMRQPELVERIQQFNPNCNEALLNRAYVYAMQKHGLQKRASGDPYFTHPLEVAAILADLRLDDATIVAALLHDTIEDTDATREEIDRLFGARIGALVDGLTKVDKLDLVSKKAKQAENLRKLLLAIADDVRVLLVKLADRLHNMRTLHYMRADKRRRIAEETMDIYAPLAGRMGMQDMREELEELSFSQINPDAYAMVKAKLRDLSVRNEGLILDVRSELEQAFAGRGLVAEVKGREKRPYSIFKKMTTKQLGFEQLSDIYGFRVIVADLDSCYRALGVVHTLWSLVPNRFKDYISTPKENDYQSIHTTVVGPRRQRVELQIRTAEMDDIAEYGIAAHAIYKDAAGHRFGGRTIQAQSEESRAYGWLRKTIEMLSDGSSAEEFLENTKLELFQDQVFCFTPKGQVINLPREATPIDFAYAIHTDVGNTCVGCKINGRSMPLTTRLQNGDEVNIIRSSAQVPPPTWEQIAVTGKARAAIRRATRDHVRKQYASLGRQVLEDAFKRAGREFSDNLLELSRPRLGQPTVPDLLAAVGRSELASADVLKAAFPDFKEERSVSAGIARAEEGWFSYPQAKGIKFRLPSAGPGTPIPVRLVNSSLPIRFAPNGGALPGDRIVGIQTADEGITIYPVQSPALQEFESDMTRWLDLRWDIDQLNSVRFPAQIFISSFNAPGSFARIAKTISDCDGNIDNIRMLRRTTDFHDIFIDLELWDLKHLNRIMDELRTVANVAKVERMNG